MYLDTLNIWNFRKYGVKGDSFDSAEPGLSVRFNGGVNVLVGENDSGKTAIIDAIKLPLLMQPVMFSKLRAASLFNLKRRISIKTLLGKELLNSK